MGRISDVMAPATASRPRRALRALLVACVAISGVAVVSPTPADATGRCSGKGADVTVPIRSFNVEWKWDKKSYRIGQTAKLDLTVTRPSHEDPVTDDGQPLPVDPPATAPADGVTVGIGLYVGDVFLSGGGITDADGKLTAPVKIQSYAKPGTADQTIYAFKRYLTETRCVYVQEFGYVKTPKVFKITR